MSIIETSINIPSDEKSRKEILSAVKEIDVAMTKIDGQKEQIKIILDDILMGYKSFGITKAMISKIAKIYHNQNLATEQGKSEDVFDLYETIFPPNIEDNANIK